jgi:hypothetical protein
MTDKSVKNNLIAKLQVVYRSPDPDPEYVRRCRREIEIQSEQLSLKHVKQNNKLINSFLRSMAFVIGVCFLSVILVLGPKEVLAAFQDLVGYIPGFGFVSDVNAVRFLEETNTITQENITLKIENVVADLDRTVISARVEGIENLKRQFPENLPIHNCQIQLLLPTDTKVNLHGYQIAFDRTDLLIDFEFDSLPKNVEQMFLGFEYIPGTPIDSAPSGWSIPINLASDSSGLRILNADHLLLESKINQGLQLQVQNISMSDKNTSIKLVLLSENPTVSIAANWWNNLVIRSSKGELLKITSQPITSFEERNQVVIETEPMLSDEIYQINLSGPINLINQVDQGNAFVLDFEKESYVGQVWRLDHDCNFGSHQCKINQAEAIQGPQERLIISFDYEADNAISNIMIFPANSNLSVNRIFSGGIEFNDVPELPLKFYIGNYTYQIYGDWQIYHAIDD